VGQYSRFFGCSQTAFSVMKAERDNNRIQNIFLRLLKLNIFIFFFLQPSREEDFDRNQLCWRSLVDIRGFRCRGLGLSGDDFLGSRRAHPPLTREKIY
jgi:hypothetical protein